MKNIEKGIVTKNTYYELGLIISVASQRGITLRQPLNLVDDIKENIQDAENELQSLYKYGKS